MSLRAVKYVVHEPFSLSLVYCRQWFSFLKNRIIPRLNAVLPPPLKRVLCAESAAPPRGLPPLLPFEVHSRRVARLLAGNPGSFTLHGTNCYVVGCGPSRTLVDCGEGRPSFGPALAAALASLRCTIDAVVITHSHFDHVGGVDQVRALLPSGVTVRKLVAPEPRARFDPSPPEPAPPEPGFDAPLLDGELLRVDAETSLRVWRTPGHCADHACFVLEEERALFSGDNVLGCGSSWFEDLPAYMATLNAMLRRANDEGLERLYPGHGPVSDAAAAKIAEYVAHRNDRERQILGALGAPSDPPLTSFEVVRRVYPGLAPYLVFAAQSNVLAHLGKLETDGLAANRHFDLWARAP